MRYGEVSQVSGPACGVLAGKRRNEDAVQVLTPGLEACARGPGLPLRHRVAAVLLRGGPWGLRRPTGS